MSRLGKKPVTLPDGVKAAVDSGTVKVEGPKGKLEYRFPLPIKVEVKEGKVFVSRSSDTKSDKSLHGLTRALINNMAIGVKDGYQKELEVRGVGYKAQASGKNLVLNLGYSHPIEFPIPEGITIETPKPTNIIIKGIDKAMVGEVAAEIRAVNPPEVYKGKGIRYVNEYVKQKAGKTVA